MNWRQYIWNSVTHYWGNHLTVALGVAVATAVLVGALVVGDSMRGSLRAITLDRLGQIDEIVVSGNFFAETFVDQIESTQTFQSDYSMAEGIIYFPKSTIETATGTKRATNCGLIASRESFWEFGNQSHEKKIVRPARMPTGQEVVINESLASQLGIEAGDLNENGPLISLRVPTPKALAADTALGKKDDTVVSLIDYKVIEIIPDRGLGRFGLHPTQIAPANAFVPLDQIQRALRNRSLKQKSNSNQVNMILLAGKEDQAPSETSTKNLSASLEPSLEDLGLYVSEVKLEYEQEGGPKETIYDYFSLSTDRMVLPETAVEATIRAMPDSRPVMTYLANRLEIKKENNAQVDLENTIPFSMVTGIQFGKEFSPRAIDGTQITDLRSDEIILTQWAADDLDAKPGDTIRLSYFDPETVDGHEVEKHIDLKLVKIAALTEPATPFGVRRRREVRQPTFRQRPELANDWNLTPYVPGVTDAESIQRWDLPFATPIRKNGKDDQYWKFYRTTPKAFVNLEQSRELWSSRFGDTTSLRIPNQGQSKKEIEDAILKQFRESGDWMGLHISPVKRQGLKASAGSTPFDILFLSLSMFVIASSVLLVALLFRLGAARRAEELGLLYALGTYRKTVFIVWLFEALLVCTAGAMIGVFGGLGYAMLLIYGLKTWWVGAISTPFLEMHVGKFSIAIGLIGGVIICVLSIAWSLRSVRKIDAQRLLTGQFEESNSFSSKSQSPVWRVIAIVCFMVALVLGFVASRLGGEAQAGAFMGSGFLILGAALILIRGWLNHSNRSADSGISSLRRLAMANVKRFPLRSWLTIALVSVASFLLIAVSSFRLQPSERGTAGFTQIVRTDAPILFELNDHAELEKLGMKLEKPDGVFEYLSFRVQAGDDASCTNPFQSAQPRVLGIDSEFIDYFDRNAPSFAWAGSAASTTEERNNPWNLLSDRSNSEVVPVVIDKNTAWYSLKVFQVGQEFTLNYDSVGPITFKLVGLLDNTILQGSLIIGDASFREQFPDQSGSRMFLVKTDDATLSAYSRTFREFGWTGKSAEKELSEYLAVQNTYLSTFQSLGGLGLLLGTIGLAVVQMRSVVERQKELALLRAVGFSPGRLAHLIALESIVLLACGLIVGIGAALCAVLPHFLVTQLSMPWLELAIVFLLIGIVGIATGMVGSRVVSKTSVVSALRQ